MKEYKNEFDGCEYWYELFRRSDEKFREMSAKKKEAEENAERLRRRLEEKEALANYLTRFISRAAFFLAFALFLFLFLWQCNICSGRYEKVQGLQYKIEISNHRIRELRLLDHLKKLEKLNKRIQMRRMRENPFEMDEPR